MSKTHEARRAAKDRPPSQNSEANSRKRSNAAKRAPKQKPSPQAAPSRKNDKPAAAQHAAAKETGGDKNSGRKAYGSLMLASPSLGSAVGILSMAGANVQGAGDKSGDEGSTVATDARNSLSSSDGPGIIESTKQRILQVLKAITGSSEDKAPEAVPYSVKSLDEAIRYTRTNLANIVADQIVVNEDGKSNRLEAPLTTAQRVANTLKLALGDQVILASHGDEKEMPVEEFLSGSGVFPETSQQTKEWPDFRYSMVESRSNWKGTQFKDANGNTILPELTGPALNRLFADHLRTYEDFSKAAHALLSDLQDLGIKRVAYEELSGLQGPEEVERSLVGFLRLRGYLPFRDKGAHSILHEHYPNTPNTSIQYVHSGAQFRPFFPTDAVISHSEKEQLSDLLDRVMPRVLEERKAGLADDEGSQSSLPRTLQTQWNLLLHRIEGRPPRPE